MNYHNIPAKLEKNIERDFYIREALIKSSCRRRPASRSLIFLDSGIRRNDMSGLIQRFLRLMILTRQLYKRTSFILFAYVFTVMTVSASCYASETLRFLAWDGYVPPHFQKKFIASVKKNHGIDLVMDVKAVDSTGDFFDALRYEKADVITPSHTLFKDQRFKMIEYNMLLPLNLENIPNHKNVIPSLQNLDFWTVDGKVYGIPLGTGPYSLAYNRKIMDDPKSLNALWDPKYKNKYVLGKEEYWANVYITALAMGYDRADIHNYKKLNTFEFQEKLKQLAENAHHMWLGVERPKDLKGMSMALMWGVALTEKNLAAQWQWSDAKEGMTFWIDLFSISHTLENKPKLKQIAEEWINFVLSDEYQAHFAMIQGGTPITTTVKEMLPEEAVKWYRLDDPEYFKEKRILWPVLNKKNQKGLLRLWKKALRRAAASKGRD